MAGSKKCAHAACSCMVADNEKYCSQMCEDSKGMTTLKCDCKHRGLHGDLGGRLRGFGPGVAPGEAGGRLGARKDYAPFLVHTRGCTPVLSGAGEGILNL